MCLWQITVSPNCVFLCLFHCWYERNSSHFLHNNKCVEIIKSTSPSILQILLCWIYDESCWITFHLIDLFTMILNSSCSITSLRCKECFECLLKIGKVSCACTCWKYSIAITVKKIQAPLKKSAEYFWLITFLCSKHCNCYWNPDQMK